MLDVRATTAALVDNAGERLRKWRLELATAGPRRAAKSFLTEAGWQPAGLIAYEPHWAVQDRMFERAARSARVDRAALSELRNTRVHGSWIRRRHVEELEVVGDYWRLLLMLTDPCAFRPPAYWSLLWALLMAEQRFQNQWVDGWSHEERLTGHFVTTLSDIGKRLRPSFEALDRAYKGGARCVIDYVDTAAARRERLTGADLGVVVHGNDDSNGEWVKVALFQVKKAESFGHFEIDFDQLQALNYTPGLGFYLLFSPNNPSGPPPVVTPASDFDFELGRRRKERTPSMMRSSEPLGRGKVTASLSEDWAVFVALAIADPGSGMGLPAPSPAEGVRLLLRGPGAPTRLLAFGLGAAAGVTNWQALVAAGGRDL